MIQKSGAGLSPITGLSTKEMRAAPELTLIGVERRALNLAYWYQA